MKYSWRNWLTQKANLLFDEAKKNIEGRNTLVPLDAEGGMIQVTSNFDSDRPALHHFALTEKDGIAQAILFVLLTPRANMRDVWRFFPVILAVLKSMPSRDLDEEKLTDRLRNMLAKATPAPDYIAKASKGTQKDDVYPVPQGFAMTSVTGATPSNWKIRGIVKTWKNAAKIQDEIKSMLSGDVDVVKLTDKLIDDIPGMDIVKAAFAVQILLGKLGCIDSHNLRIYTDYLYGAAKGKNRNKFLQMIADLDPAGSITSKDLGLPGQFSASQLKKGDLKTPEGIIPKALKSPSNKITRGRRSETGRIDRIARYVRALEMLEAESGIGTREMWDIWTNYVAQINTYQSGISTYSTHYGSGLDPKDLEKVKLGDTVPYIPKGQVAVRSHKPGEGPRLKLEPSPSSRAVGMAHRFDKLQPRDIIDPTIDMALSPMGSSKKDKYPFLNVLGDDRPASDPAAQSQKVHPLLYWVAQDPELADYVGFGPKRRKELMDILRHHGLSK